MTIDKIVGEEKKKTQCLWKEIIEQRYDSDSTLDRLYNMIIGDSSAMCKACDGYENEKKCMYYTIDKDIIKK